MKRIVLAVSLVTVCGLLTGADLASDVIAGKPAVPVLMMQRGSDGRLYPVNGSSGSDGGGGVALPGYKIDVSTVVCMTCPAAGSTSYKVPWECAEFNTANEALYECGALTCVNDGGTVGQPYAASARGPRCWDQTTTGGADGGASGDKSCWSASGTGKICWTKIKP